MKKFLLINTVLVAASWMSPTRAAMIAEDNQPRAVIVVPASGATNAASAKARGQSVSDAASELRSYLQRSTGAAFESAAEDQLTAKQRSLTQIFVGLCDATKSAVTTNDLQPEGFIIKIAGKQIHIVGQDRTKEGIAVNGTTYGCYAFLEKFLGVRWLMPGELGEVVPAHATLSIDDTEIREEPLLWQRRIRDSELHAHRDRIPQILQAWGVSIPEWEKNFATAITGPWFTHQRLGSRVKLSYGHAYGGWWNRYHEKYPEIFAQQPNGTRNTGPVREKLCVSNPTTWRIVAEEKIRELRADPFLTAASISPNDGGGSEHCSCAQCRAWDPKRPAKIDDDDPDAKAEGVSFSLTDRYFRFYNEVAKLVANEIPDRYLGAYAYSIYRVPPVELDRLEKNLIVGYVGFGSYFNDVGRTKDREYWLQWGRLANQLFIRPNLFWSGLGLPRLYVRKLASDLRFIAKNGMRATDYDGLVGNWGTDGLNYYGAARLLWNPGSDPGAIIDDYCASAYGSGANAMKAYYARVEKLTDAIAAEGKYGSEDQNKSRLQAATFVAYYTDELLNELREFTHQAIAAIGSSDAKATARVNLVAEGLDYAPHVRRLILAAAAVRNGTSSEADYKKVFAEENRYFASLAFSWSVSMAHNYSYIRNTLILK